MSTTDFVFTLEEIGTGIHELRLDGSLNEDVNLGEIAEHVHGLQGQIQTLSIDLSQIRMLNSCGVREWILFLEDMMAFTKVQFSRVGKLFVEQASTVPNILGKPGTHVYSIELPYFCNTCSAASNVFLETSKIPLLNGVPRAPQKKCHRCGAVLELDAFEEEYFNFLTYMKAKK